MIHRPSTKRQGARGWELGDCHSVLPWSDVVAKEARRVPGFRTGVNALNTHVLISSASGVTKDDLWSFYTVRTRSYSTCDDNKCNSRPYTLVRNQYYPANAEL